MSGKRRKVAVIGAGIFGCGAAIALSYVGFDVVLIERRRDIIMGTTRNNTNRVHLGFHYPRDWQTAKMCRDNYRKFITIFASAILNGFPNLYCIAKENSSTSADEYLRFCDKLGVPYSRLDLSTYPTEIQRCVLGVLSKESVCDIDILRKLVTSVIQKRDNMRALFETDVLTIERKNGGYCLYTQTGSKLAFDAVVNCCYSDSNRLTIQLGHKVQKRQFEYTVVPVIEMDLPVQGITIMDGQFMTLLPYGKTGFFTLYHVNHSVIETEIRSVMKREWLCPEKGPFSRMDKEAHFQKMLQACRSFVPFLADARLCGFLEGPRMVMAGHEKDDARPSLVQDYGDGYLTVFSGKIDHFSSIAESVCEALGGSKLSIQLLKGAMNMPGSWQRLFLRC